MECHLEDLYDSQVVIVDLAQNSKLRKLQDYLKIPTDHDLLYPPLLFTSHLWNLESSPASLECTLQRGTVMQPPNYDLIILQQNVGDNYF